MATPGSAPAPNPRTAVGDGRTADRGQWGVGRAGAREDRDAVGSGDHDRDLGRAPLGGAVGRAAVQRSWRCCWRWPAAPRRGTAWVRLVRSAICGGQRARAWWRAGSRPARVGWWPRPAVPKRGNRASPAALGDGHRQPRKRPFEPSRAIHHVPRYRCRLPRCCATRWSPRWRPWCCADGPREPRYARVRTLPAPTVSTWTVARCGSACVPCNAGARPAPPASSPPWSRGSAPAPRPHRH